MPGFAVPRWISNPIEVVDETFASCPSYRDDIQGFQKKIEEIFRKCANAEEHDYRYLVPSINGIATSAFDTSPVAKLVRFRCMVQSECPTLYHQPFLDIRNKVSGEVRTICAMYKEHIKLQEDDEALFFGHPPALSELQSFKCVTIPGEATWAYDEGCSESVSPLLSTSVTANFFADAGASLKINDACELFGVLVPQSYQNATEAVLSHTGEDHSLATCSDLMLNVFFFDHLPHGNPKVTVNKNDLMRLMPTWCDARPFLLQALQSCLCGDAVAAEYLLLHLLSSTYTHLDGVPIGNLSMNVTNVPADSGLVSETQTLITSLLSPVVSFRCTIPFLNAARMAPKLNVETEKDNHDLLPGLLQLIKHTQLVLDETSMETGVLTHTGISNLLALQNLAKDQNVHFDYVTQNVEFHMDVPVLVLSQTRSLIDCRFVVPLNHLFPRTGYALSEETVSLIRQYITAAKFAQYEVEEDMRQEIVEEFVRWRKTDRSITGDNLLDMLELARYMSISHGQQTLSKDNWQKVVMLETERRRRIKEQINA